MSNSVYEIITNRIIEELEKNNIPWKKPWLGSINGAYSRISGKPYSFINQMLLSRQGEYLTFNEIKKLKGSIKKGAKSEIVCFYKPLSIKEKDENEDAEEKIIPMLRYYRVFHISDTIGIKPIKHEILTASKPIENAEYIKNTYVKRENIKINEVISDKAFYNPADDSIQVPQIGQFETSEEFYSTLFHEIVHSAGHKSRLNRLTKKSFFADKSYSKEELCAEIGSATILNQIGIETSQTFKNSTAYIKSWLNVLKNDNKFIIQAAAKAEKAVKFILGEKEQ